MHDDGQAWERLVRRYARLVHGIAMRAGLNAEDAADASQNVFLTAYGNLHLLDRPESVSYWLATIARREAWEARRRLARQVPRSDHGAEATEVDVASPAPLPDEELERLQRLLLVERAVERLDERCRKLLDLLFFRDPAMSYADAARRLGIPLGGIGPTRARCLEKLRRVLEELGF